MWDSSSGSPVLSSSASLVILFAYSAAPSSSARGLKAAANARNGVGPGRKDSAFQNRSRSRRKAGSRPAKTSEDLPLPDRPTTITNGCSHLADKFANGSVRIVWAAAAEEERRVLFPECVEATVGADGLAHHFGQCPAATNGPYKLLEDVGRVGHSAGMGEVDPGQNAEKIERGI